LVHRLKQAGTAAKVRRRALDRTHRLLRRLDAFVLTRLEARSPSGKEPYVSSLEEAHARNWEGCPCVFVLSTGRTGTMTLARLLNLSPSVEAVHEPTPKLVKASFDAYMEGGPAVSDAKWKDVVRAAREELVYEANKRGKVYVETNNRMTYLASAAKRAFPASKFIHIYRHPYDVIVSEFRRGVYESHNWDYARIRPRRDNDRYERWDRMSPLEKIAWYWSAVNSESLDFLESLPSQDTLGVRSEDLFARDEDCLETLFEFAESDLPPRLMIEEILRQRLNRQSLGEPMAPTDWTEKQMRAVKSLIGVTAERLGYEL
jgi:hypothetical protein